MSSARVGKWGRSLAIRVPQDIAQAAGLEEGERVEVEVQARNIVVRRKASEDVAVAASKAAAEAIAAETRRYTLGDITARSLIEEGRRG